MTAANFSAFVLYSFCVYSSCAHNVYRYSTAVNESIFLQCSQEQKKIQWKFQENLLFIGGFLLRDDFSKSLILLQNNSLYISPITLLHIGKYECFKNKETMSTFVIDVEAPPKIFIWINNTSYYNKDDSIYLPFNKSVTVSCNAIGSRPAVNLSFTIDNDEVSRTDSYTTTNVGSDGKTSDTKTTFILHATKESGNLLCQSSPLTYFSERRLDVKYFTYDHMLRTNDFHWGSYVKQLVELKQHDKLLEIEGLCIAADRLYVVYEHLPGTRLTDHIEETLGEDTRLRYVMDITEGIGFIHSKGFLHPGLSTSTVLLSRGQCNVYDFYSRKMLLRR